MKVKHFILFSSLIALLFALVMTFVPLQFLHWLGFDGGGFTVFISRDYATAMLAFSLGLWLVRKEQASRTLTVVLLMWGVFNMAEGVVNLAAFLAGSLRPDSNLAAIPLSLHVIFALGSACFLLKQKGGKRKSQGTTT
jgi:hypothetical protein